MSILFIGIIASNAGFATNFGRARALAKSAAAGALGGQTRGMVLVRTKVGNDDLCKVYLNGKKIYRQAHRRSYVLDQDNIGVDLKSALNVLVLKLVRLHEVLYVGPGWQASVHFTDETGRPVKDLRVSLTPP